MTSTVASRVVPSDGVEEVRPTVPKSIDRLILFQLCIKMMQSSSRVPCMAKRRKRVPDADRLTVSLAKGQRQSLEAIADRNAATLAFVVRCALTQFIDLHRDRQLQLQFAHLSDDEARR